MATFTDAQNRALVKKAIACAEAQASADVDFVQILRATYFAEHPQLRRMLRTAPGNGRPKMIQTALADPELTIFEDPRFLENVRRLAEETKKNLRILGGEKVRARHFPDCVAVGSDHEWACTGTLIAPKLVLSAGHCSSYATRVFFGNDVKKKGTVISVERAVRHPEYHKGKNHDILLLLLEHDATVQPRAIAPTAMTNAATIGRAVGFGNTDATGSFGYGTKRQADLPIASPSCDGSVNDQTDNAAYGCDAMLELVAGKPLLARDSCRGDSGGPFYVGNEQDGWFLAGATSRSTKSSVRTCGDGGVYTRVDRYREWIEDTAKVKLA